VVAPLATLKRCLWLPHRSTEDWENSIWPLT